METLGGRLLQHAHEPVLCIGLRRGLGGATAAIAARISKALRAGTSRKNVCYSRFLPSRWSTRWLADDNVALLGMGFTTTSATSVWVFLTLALKTQACCKIDESTEHWFIASRFTVRGSEKSGSLSRSLKVLGGKVGLDKGHFHGKDLRLGK